MNEQICNKDKYNARIDLPALKMIAYVMRCAIWYHFYNWKNMKNTYGGVLILVKLQASIMLKWRKLLALIIETVFSILVGKKAFVFNLISFLATEIQDIFCFK